MNTVLINLESYIQPLLGLSASNRQWIAERLIEPERKSTHTKAEAKGFDEMSVDSWMAEGYSKEFAEDMVEALDDCKNGRYAFKGTAEEAIKWMESL